jgi:hypothetical protein
LTSSHFKVRLDVSDRPRFVAILNQLFVHSAPTIVLNMRPLAQA